MARAGANKVYIVASHGIFADNCMDLIDLSPVDKVIVTDSVQLPSGSSKCSTKISQVSVAAGLAKIIESEMRHMSYIQTNVDDEDYEVE
jgi:ribose-phosphate pyrophosphokinase